MNVGLLNVRCAAVSSQHSTVAYAKILKVFGVIIYIIFVVLTAQWAKKISTIARVRNHLPFARAMQGLIIGGVLSTLWLLRVGQNGCGTQG